MWPLRAAGAGAAALRGAHAQLSAEWDPQLPGRAGTAATTSSRSCSLRPSTKPNPQKRTPPGPILCPQRPHRTSRTLSGRSDSPASAERHIHLGRLCSGHIFNRGCCESLCSLRTQPPATSGTEEGCTQTRSTIRCDRRVLRLLPFVLTRTDGKARRGAPWLTPCVLSHPRLLSGRSPQTGTISPPVCLELTGCAFRVFARYIGWLISWLVGRSVGQSFGLITNQLENDSEIRRATSL